jgi:hypothetical protein
LYTVSSGCKFGYSVTDPEDPQKLYCDLWDSICARFV